VDETTRANRTAWETASRKHVIEYDEHLAAAAAGTSLLDRELDLLSEVLSTAPTVVHPQSGGGLDDHSLLRAGAKRVIGVDYSVTAAGAAQRRADDLGAAIRYVVGAVPGVPLRDGCADLVYTGKGALIWMRDITAWAAGLARLLRPGGHLFVYEGHPCVPLWAWDEDEERIRPDRSYFASTFANDSFPANGAVEWQWTMGHIVTAIVEAGLAVRRLVEYPEPFWRMGELDAAAWRGRLPNTYALLAEKLAR
jgi:SAM-dependent methyltransferase